MVVVSTGTAQNMIVMCALCSVSGGAPLALGENVDGGGTEESVHIQVRKFTCIGWKHSRHAHFLCVVNHLKETGLCPHIPLLHHIINESAPST